MRNLIRSEARRLFSEFPQGDPNGGAAFGERNEPATIALISTIATGVGAVSSIAGLLGGGKSSSTAAPQVSKPTVMPIPDDEAALAAKRRSLLAQSQRRGRDSTILSDDSSSDLLGA